MRENKINGFTLIEIVAVITILGILALIAVPAVNKIIRDSRKTLYDAQMDGINDGIKNYIADNINNLSEDIPNVVGFDVLKQDGYIDETSVPNENNECLLDDSEVTITYNGVTFTYAINQETGEC